MSSPCNWDVWLCRVTHRQSLTPQKAVSTLIKWGGNIPWACLETSLRRLYYETLWRNTSGNQPRSYVKLKNIYIYISHPAPSWTILFLTKFQQACDFHITTIVKQNVEILQSAVKLTFGKMLKFCKVSLNWLLAKCKKNKIKSQDSTINDTDIVQTDDHPLPVYDF